MKETSPLLAIDTSTSRAYCAVRSADGVMHEEVSREEVSHNEELSKNITTVLSRANVTPSDIRGIIIGSGPGSFTGLRIGYSVAKGMAFALGIPLVEISSHFAIALGAEVPSGAVIVLGDARRDEFFCSAFRFTKNGRESEELLRPHIMPSADLARLLSQFPAEEPVRILSEIAPAALPQAPVEVPRGLARGLLAAIKHDNLQQVSLDRLASMAPQYLRAVAAMTIAERVLDKAQRRGQRIES